MRRRIAARAEIVHRAHQSLTEVMLPNAIHDYTREQRTGAVLGVGHPFRHSTSLLRGIGPEALRARPGPIVRGCFASHERSQETNLDRFAFCAEITTSQQKGFARLGAKVCIPKGCG